MAPATLTSALATATSASTQTAGAGAGTSTAARTATAPTRTTATSASNVRLPATFTIKPGGTLSPPAISAPAAVPIALTIVSGDGRSHHIVLELAKPEALSVAAGGRVSVLLTAVRNGTYPVTLDGRRDAGSLTIGAAPGP